MHEPKDEREPEDERHLLDEFDRSVQNAWIETCIFILVAIVLSVLVVLWINAQDVLT